MTGLFDFLSYAIGISQTRWRIFAPALVISVLISDSILVAVGAGVTQGASVMLGIALLAMFALATLTGLLKKKSVEINDWRGNLHADKQDSRNRKFPKDYFEKKMEALSIWVAVIRHPNEYQKLLSTE